MSRCFSCSQENCGSQHNCDCSCHVQVSTKKEGKLDHWELEIKRIESKLAVLKKEQARRKELALMISDLSEDDLILLSGLIKEKL